MSQFERVYKIDRLLRSRIAPNKQKLLTVLEVSEPTLKRDLEYMRSRLGAPIAWNRQTGSYSYAADQPEFTLSLIHIWFCSFPKRWLRSMLSNAGWTTCALARPV